MKNFLRRATLAIGLAGLALTTAQASIIKISFTLDFEDLHVVNGSPFTFDPSQPYAGIYTAAPPAAGVNLTQSDTNSIHPQAATYSDFGYSGPSGGGNVGLGFATNMKFAVLPPGDHIYSIRFITYGSINNINDDGGALSSSVPCTGGQHWCDSTEVVLDANSTSVTLLAGSATIDNVTFVIEHDTSGDGGSAPEPASAALVVVALVGAGVASRRSKIGFAHR